MNGRQKTLVLTVLIAALLLLITLGGTLNRTGAVETDFARKNLAPGLRYLFGTDWMGRDMFARTLCGLSLSIRIGALTAVFSGVLSLLLGAAAAMNRHIDAVVSWCIDLVLGVPHILLVILISLAFGKGYIGVVAGMSLSHWPSLARVMRSEVLQLRHAPFIEASQKLGVGTAQLIFHHMLPHMLPQFITGLLLQFPHAILHEASVTFLGFGLSPEQPAVGIILSESMRYLTTGKWWLSLFPGLSLVAVVLLFAALGERVRQLFDPSAVHR